MGLFTTTAINKEFHWPNHMELQESIDDMQGQYVGNNISCKGTVTEYNDQYYMVSLVYSLQNSPMITNMAITRRDGDH